MKLKTKGQLGVAGALGGLALYLHQEKQVTVRKRSRSLEDLRRAGASSPKRPQQQTQQPQDQPPQTKKHDFTDLTTVFGLHGYLISVLRATRSRHLRRMIACSVTVTVATRRYFPATSWGTALYRCFLVFWGLYYHFKVVEHPTVSFLHTHWNMAVTNRMRVPPFSPTVWAFNCHAQTAVCNGLNGLMAFFGRDVPVERETLVAYDGNDIHLDWTVNDQLEPEERALQGCSQLSQASPIVLICHGIFGDADENYGTLSAAARVAVFTAPRVACYDLLRLTRAPPPPRPPPRPPSPFAAPSPSPAVRNIGAMCRARGWRAVVNWRWRLDFGESRDIAAAIEHIQRRFPIAPIVAVGYSAGGHLLASYLQAVGSETPLVAAVIASASFDLVDTMDGVRARGSECSYLRAALNEATRNCVHRHIAHDRFFDFDACDAAARAAVSGGAVTADGRERETEAVARRKRKTEALLKEVPALDGPTMYDAFLELQNEYSGQHMAHPQRMAQHARYGRKTDGHYNGTAGYNMHKIGITTMVLHADDDPVTAPGMRQRVYEACAKNKHIIRISTRRGGHVGWHEGILCSGPSWADNAVVEFFSGVFALHAQTSFILDVQQAAASSDAQLDAVPSPRELVPGSCSEDSESSDASVPTAGLAKGMHPSRIARICSGTDLALHR